MDNCKIEEIAKTYGTPVYIYDADRMRENYSRIADAFKSLYPNTGVFYAVKANSNPGIISIFNELGAGMDCSSPLELALAQKAGVFSEKLMYTGNYESVSDLSAAVKAGAAINLDDRTSLERLKKAGVPDRISFRINPGIGRGGFEGIITGGTDAKFGIPYEEAGEAYKSAQKMGISRFGIHMMTGSNNLEPLYFAQIVEKLMIIAADIFSDLGSLPEYIDIGGGFGVPYEDNEPPLDIKQTAQRVVDTFLEKCQRYGFGEPELRLEPGRYLAADAGVLATTVTGKKKSYRDFIGVDAGMNTLLRPALYDAHHRIVTCSPRKGDVRKVSVCGRICENSDIFMRNAFLPPVEEGDLLYFRDAGAYGFAMASSYNGRLRPAEVLVDGDSVKLIRKPETSEDIFDGIVYM
ncbi:MAG: diaminopimelate decarboxylase [bacterium]